MEPVPYQDIATLETLIVHLQSALKALWRGAMSDAARGYWAYTHKIPAELLSWDERENHPWYQEAPTFSAHYPDHEQALWGINAIWFDDRQDPKRMLKFPGLVGCSMDTLQFVDDVNRAKAELEAYVIALRKRQQDLTDHDIIQSISNMGDWTTLSGVKQVFRKVGASRICLKQLYRSIKTLPGPLAAVRYYWKPKTPGGTQTTVGEYLARLFELEKKRSESRSFAIPIAALRGLPASFPLAIKQKPNLEINASCLVKSPHSNGEYGRIRATAVLPIFFPTEPGIKPLASDIDFGALDKPYKKKITHNRQRKWAAEPFLPAYRLYLPVDYPYTPAKSRKH